MTYLGDFKDDDSLYHKFTTRTFDTGVPATLADTPVLSCYADEGTGTVKTTSETYFDLDVDFNSKTGLNNVRIDLSGDPFFTTGTDYAVVITTGEVDSVSVIGETICTFSIENRANDITAISGSNPAADNLEAVLLGTGAAGNVDLSARSVTIDNDTDSALIITSSDDSAIKATSSGGNGHGLELAGNGTGEGLSATGGATGEGIEAIGGATSGAGFRAAAQNNNDAGMELVKHGTGVDLDADELGYLLGKAVSGTEVIDDSVIAFLASSAGTADWDTFVNTTDSLQAIRDGIVAANPQNHAATANTETPNTTLDGGTFADTATNDDATYYQTGPGADPGSGFGLDCNLTFAIGVGRVPLSVTIDGKFSSGAQRTVQIWAYNYTTTDYNQLSNAENDYGNSAADSTQIYSLIPDHRQLSDGEVTIRATSTSTTGTDVWNWDYASVSSVAQEAGGLTADVIATAVHDELDEHLKHIQCFTGEMWYVTTAGADTNVGHTPDDAFLTIGAAITASAAGDRIVVKAGTYSEAGFEMPSGKDGLELVCEHGTLLTDSGSSTQTMLITGNSCVFTGAQVTESGQIGVKVTGNNCRLENIVSGLSNTVGFDIDGGGCFMSYCLAAIPTAEGFNLGGGQIKMYHCETISATATIGFHVSAGNYGIIKDCNSNGHSTNGWKVAAGVNDVMIVDCSSGPDDGAASDAGTNISWRNFSDATLPTLLETGVDAGLDNAISSPTTSSAAYYLQKQQFALVNKLVITETNGNTEMFDDAESTLGSIAAAFDSDGTYTTRKEMIK